MKYLYFVRHGESEFNKSGIWTGTTDSPLTELGRKQAINAGKKLRSLRIDNIVSSPLIRAHDTAKLIATQINYPVDKIVITPQSVERSFGELEGDVAKLLTTNYINDEASIDDYEGVEKLRDMQKRAEDFLAYLQTLPHETILVVGHGAFGRGIRRAVNSKPTDYNGYRLKNAEIARFI